ncbi:Glycosyltransferase involved in cell wall bisynthesis [Algoriphagus locisalis]|uniref:Glycosyltransferase involved in cell wall bisynthesis n=1 Tax=Algoriphagus locisalis TaxID=305507 RepID=A0A1I6XQP7_9BACT|nr:glycosyltransferase [Algoriphagus locisalis]SFT40231.1 Glycosyltransferase involved in cell wall bisynthesis [Algoriphagus locisalis]
MRNIRKRILFLIPGISMPGGQELENIGFANFLNSDPSFEVEILNFFCLLKSAEFEELPKVAWSLVKLKKVLSSKQFLKIYVKSGFAFKQSLAYCFRDFPHLFDSWLSSILKNFDLCFAGISPRILLPHVLDLCQKANVKFVYHESSIFHPKNNLFYQQLEKNGFFLISAKEKEDYLLKNYPDSSYYIIKQWIYIGQSDFLSISPVKNEVVKFGGLGRIDVGKNFKVILEALIILKRKAIKVEFSLYGDGPELTNLKKISKDNGLDNIVSFKGGFAFDKRDICFKEIDVFIMTSSFEGGPLVVLEAMASRKPIISTRVGDVPNRVFEDVNGYILPVHCSASDLAIEMEKYIFDRELVSSHGRNSREIFLRDFERSKSELLFKKSIESILEKDNK